MYKRSNCEIDDGKPDRQRSVGLLGGSRRLSIAGPARVGVPRLPVPSHETNCLNAHNPEDNTLSNVNLTAWYFNFIENLITCSKF